METPSGAQPVGEGEAGMEGSKEVKGMDVAEGDWQTEEDNLDEGAMSGVSTSKGPTTPAPTSQVENPDPDPGHADHGEQENGRRGGYAAAHQENAALQSASARCASAGRGLHDRGGPGEDTGCHCQ